METNWAPEVKSLQEKGLLDHLNSQVYLSEPLGVAGIVVTSDSHVIFQQRNHWLAEGAGQMDVPGGHPEPNEACKTKEEKISLDDLSPNEVLKEVFESQLKEVRDEVNIPLSQLEEPRLMGIIRNRLSGGRPVAYFHIKCTLKSDEVRNLYLKGGAETDESIKLTFLPEEDIACLQEKNKTFWNQLCPNGKAACTIYAKVNQKF
uniref:Nudix hydrolase domain-containing protein n=1 Tax=Ciona savignyi TaxID=51511 RepID=H2ZFK0_CIOSA